MTDARFLNRLASVLMAERLQGLSMAESSYAIYPGPSPVPPWPCLNGKVGLLFFMLEICTLQISSLPMISTNSNVLMGA